MRRSSSGFRPAFIEAAEQDIILWQLARGSRQCSPQHHPQLLSASFCQEHVVSVKIVHTEQAPAAIGPYSQATIANGFLFTAGQIALDPATGHIVPGDVVAQAERVMRNLQAILDAAKASWNDVVKTTIFLYDLNDFSRVNEVYARALGQARPARSTVQVAALPRGVLVEIEAIAALT